MLSHWKEKTFIGGHIPYNCKNCVLLGPDTMILAPLGKEDNREVVRDDTVVLRGVSQADAEYDVQVVAVFCSDGQWIKGLDPQKFC
jgi:hypothetical protein